MFTGIVTDIGVIKTVGKKQNGVRMIILTKYPVSRIKKGASISCSGVCLTVTKTGKTSNKNWFEVDVSDETLNRTTIKSWKSGYEINLEQAMKIGDEFGGHIVTGHIDGTAIVKKIERSGDNSNIIFELPVSLSRFVAEKGSVTIDGVSLTVNGIKDRRFWVNIVPFTLENTVIRNYKTGTIVNIEVDIIARYIARIIQMSQSHEK